MITKEKAVEDRQKLLDTLEMLLFKCDDEKSMTRAVGEALKVFIEIKTGETV